MTFWTYMLHCHGGCFYVGNTDDLERCIHEHQSGLIAGFTADHQPVELVWSSEFQTRDDATAAELKLKGWSRAKKLALIRGDWELISALAKKKDSGWSSAPFGTTSSARTDLGEGEVLNSEPPGPKPTPSPQTARPEPVEGLSFSLQPHPQTLPRQISGVRAIVSRDVGNCDLIVTFVVDADPRHLKLPKLAKPYRTDELWRTTCFELFVKMDGEDYLEFNFSSSTQWAIYGFEEYRKGMMDWPVDEPPVVNPWIDFGHFGITCTPKIRNLEGRIALSAVIEETDGTKSYWALAHPAGKPDFHHPDCFVATLPPPNAP